MYENNNTVSIDWKGLFIKLIIVALIIFAIFKGYEYFSNNKPGNSKTTTSTATQLFNANLESLRQAGENYYDYSNYPKNGQTVMVTLGELVTKGNIKELYDENGNECNRENSYVAVTNDGGQYKLKATLSCGETSNYTVVMIGCECEGDECAQAIQKLENEKNTSSSSNKTSSSTKTESSSKKETSSETETAKQSNNNVKKTTTKKTTKVVDMSNDNDDTTKKTTTKTTTRKTTSYNKTTYRVKFDSNGGDSVETQYVEKYDSAIEPEDPEKDDARFVGWYYNGRLWDFDNEITKNITLEAYYWETKTITKTVYTAGWDAYGTTYMTVTHKLAVPTELQEDNIKNVRIKNIRNARSMSSANDLYYHSLYHSKTFDGYINNGSEYNYDSNAGYTLGRLYNINVRKTYSYTYDRWVTWSGYVGNQCSYTFDGYNCNYGIVYNVVWEYDELTD